MKKLPPELWRRILSFCYTEHFYWEKIIEQSSYLEYYKAVKGFQFHQLSRNDFMHPYWQKVIPYLGMKFVCTEKELINYQTYLVVAQIRATACFSNTCPCESVSRLTVSYLAG
jgi:hypothetical protein